MSRAYLMIQPKSFTFYATEAAMQIREKIKEIEWNKSTKKNIFFFTNICFLVLGIGSAAAGIWLYLEKNDFIELTPSNYSALSAAGLCVFTGAAVCIISIVGALGALMESRCLLITYLCFVALLSLVQAVTGTTGLFYKESSRERIRLDLLHNINRTHITTRHGHSIPLEVTWDHLQKSLSCCGVDNFSDWHYNVQWPSNKFVPDSCCNSEKFGSIEDMNNCGKTPEHPENFYQKGCYAVFADWLFHHIHIVSTVSAVLLLVEIAVIIITIILLLHLRQSGKCPSYQYSKGLNSERVARMRSVSEGL